MLNRVFGVGLAAAIAALTLVLAATGRIALYISPDGAWFAVVMAVVALAGAVLSFALPLGAEEGAEALGAEEGAEALGAEERAEEDGHAHGTADAEGLGLAGGTAFSVRPPQDVVTGADADTSRRLSRAAADSTGAFGRHSGDMPHLAPVERHTGDPHDHAHDRDHARPRRAPAIASIAGGVLATGVVATALLVPPATLSAELAMSRDTGTPPLFAGADTVALAATGDTASFGIGEWASVFATTTNPDAFDGTDITLTGFATTGDDGFRLTRLVVTHCVIDAQPASLPVATADLPETGQWVTVSGVVRDLGGRLTIEPVEVALVDEPEDPYEF